MSEKYTPVKGDRVRVVIEGEVDEYGGDSFEVNPGAAYSNIISPTAEHVVSIEKIEPPVEVFKPGDVVRVKGEPGRVYALADCGWIMLTHGGKNYGRGFVKGDPSKEFTSDIFEKVEIG